MDLYKDCLDKIDTLSEKELKDLLVPNYCALRFCAGRDVKLMRMGADLATPATADDIEAHLLADPDLAYEVVARIYLRIVTPWKPSGVAGFMRELAFCDDSGIGAYAEDDEGKAKVDELLKRRGFVLAEEDHDG